MILRDIKTYIQERRKVPLQALCDRFETDAETLRPMLQHWIHKGTIHKLDSSDTCGGCIKCNPLWSEVYEWCK